MNTVEHLISKHGVLVSFSIAKKVSKTDIKKLNDRLKKDCKDPKQFNKMLNDEISKFTQQSLKQEEIPGIIINSNNKDKTNTFITDETKLLKLNHVSSTIAKKLIDANYTKDEICYVILSMLSSLGLSDEDFRNFHKKYGNNPNETDDTGEDEDPEY
jgi:hypothetical protein